MYILTTDASITDRSEDKKQLKTFKVAKNLLFQDKVWSHKASMASASLLGNVL